MKLFELKEWVKKRWPVILVLGLFIFLHIYLVSKTFYIDPDHNIHTAYAGYGDIPFHMTQIAKFAKGSLLDFNEPIFNGDHIRYAFFINYISGVFLRLTGSWTFSFHAPAMIFIAVSAILTYIFYLSILKKRWAAVMALILFFLGSGMGAYGYVKDNFVGAGYSISAFSKFMVDKNISTINKYSAIYPEQNISWGGPISLVFLHQRAFFMGFFLLTLILYLLIKDVDLRRQRTVTWIAILFGILPLGHYHSFITAGVILGIYFLNLIFNRNYQVAKRMALTIFIGLLVALPLIFSLASGREGLFFSNENSFVNFRLGWMSQPTFGSVIHSVSANNLPVPLFNQIKDYLKFTWVNFGIVLPIFLFGLVFLMFNKKSVNEDSNDSRNNIVLFGSIALVLFTLTQTIRFQPWDYDNNKLLVYFQFFSAPLIIYLFVLLIKKTRLLGTVLLIITFVIGILSGGLDLLPRVLVERQKMPVIFSNETVRLAYFIENNITPSEVVLSSSTHLNPVSSLAGRPTVVGYPGWLWTKGLDFTPREEDLKKFYAEPSKNLAILKKYKVHYVLLDPSAKNEWGGNRNTLDGLLKVMYSSENYTLYQVPQELIK